MAWRELPSGIRHWTGYGAVTLNQPIGRFHPPAWSPHPLMKAFLTVGWA
jgi:hypothetical protein